MIKCLIINPFGIGDVLFTTALIKAIKNAQHDSLIAYWCNARVKGILSDNPNISKIFAISRGDLKKIYHQSRLRGIKEFFSLLQQIKKERFDLAFDFSLDYRYSLIAKLLGIKKRVGFNYKNRGRFLNNKIDIDGYKHKHVVEYYLDLLKFIDIQPNATTLDLFISEADKLSAQDILTKGGVSKNDLLVAIAPGAGASWGCNASFKHWPAINYARLLDKIINYFAAKIAILGDISERYIAQEIINNSSNKLIDLTGRTTLGESIAIISKANLLVTNDGGPLHIAVAVGIKTVSIFGPVDEFVYGPYPASDKHLVVKAPLECRPCYQNFRLPACDKNRACLNSISVEDVFNAVKRLL